MFSFHWDRAILRSSFEKIPQSFSNYPSLKASEVHNCGNIKNTLKNNDIKTPVLFCKYLWTKAQIFMKSYVVVNYYLVSLWIHEDSCINVRARVVKGHTHVLLCLNGAATNCNANAFVTFVFSLHVHCLTIHVLCFKLTVFTFKTVLIQLIWYIDYSKTQEWIPNHLT